MRQPKRAASAFLSLAVLTAAIALPLWAIEKGRPSLPTDTAPVSPTTTATTTATVPKTSPSTALSDRVIAVSAEPVIEQQPALLDAATIPKQKDGGGTVIEDICGGGTAIGQQVSIKNISHRSYDWTSLLKGKTVQFADTTEPQVLILHTHTTESYMTYYAGYYNADDVARSKNPATNVCAVGEVLANRLRAAGIGVIHDTTLYDSPEYTGAYGRAETSIQKFTKKYPSLKLILDLHRDAVLRDSVTRIKPTVTVDGQKAAQVMLVLGANDTDGNPNPTWKNNVRLGFQLTAALQKQEELLCRPVNLTETNYNQNLLPNGAMLLVEIGTDVNTFSEAMVSATLIGDALVDIMRA